MKNHCKCLILVSLILQIGCQSSYQRKPTLPEAISNNATAVAIKDSSTPAEYWLYSFNGLKAGKTWRDVSSSAFAFNPLTGESKTLPDVPGSSGRLASIAATVDNKIYIFGGYTVEENHTEVSTPEVYRFDPSNESYEMVTTMPTPVDDSVALVYQDRYVYLVSGWHNDGNVSLVQVLDTLDMSWHQATPYPGAPVFGHAAGIVKNKLVVSDGVKVIQVVNGKRQYGMSDENYIGTINKDDFKTIHWKRINNHPSPARYRMAATGSKHLNKVIFVGGSNNPYNFNGIGYNGIPSDPQKLIFAYDFSSNNWQVLGEQHIPSMDHRALLETKHGYYLLGGMLKNQQTTSNIINIELD